MTTGHLDALAERYIRAQPAPCRRSRATSAAERYGKGPKAFPASTCISIDRRGGPRHPGRALIRDGSIVSVDVGAIVDGWHGDGARSVHRRRGDARGSGARRRDPAARSWPASRRRASGARVGDISAAIEDVGQAGGYGIVRPFVGHGIGTEMHQDPQVPNYRTGSRGAELQPGICLAIEPMFTLGDGDVYVEADGWTVATATTPGRPLRAHDRDHGQWPRDLDDRLGEDNRPLPRFGFSDTLRFRVSARPGRHSV